MNRDEAEVALTLVKKHALFLSNRINADYVRVLEIICTMERIPPCKEAEFARLSGMQVLDMTESKFLKFLRDYKYDEYLKICVRELYLKDSLEVKTAHLTAVANTALEFALLYALASVACRYNIKDYPQNMAIIGLGKLGARELNFSSDIDIVFVYSEAGEDILLAGIRDITYHEYYSEVAKKTVELMMSHTTDGFVFRVDTRLRPEGEQGALALPVSGYSSYYESYGQTWERMMLLKGGHSAGSREVSAAFFAAVRSFIFRRTLDKRFIDEATDILRKAQARAKLRYKGAKNVKLGRGGLREIEFLTQILEIIAYPKHKIDTAATLETLDKLAVGGAIAPKDAAFMAEAYRFYRELEHKAQLANEQQIYTVPENASEFALFLERCGYSDAALFEDDYKKYADGVSAIYNCFIGDDKRRITLGEFLFDDLFDEAEAALSLKRLGAKEPERCANILYHAMYSPASGGNRPQDMVMMKTIFGKALEQALTSDTLATILATYRRLFNSSSALYMLYEYYNATDGKILADMNRLFALSPYLTDTILQNKGIIELIFNLTLPQITQASYKNKLLENLSAGGFDTEAEYEYMRRAHKEMLFRIAYPFINDKVNVLAVMEMLSELARAVAEVAFTRCYNDLAVRYGRPSGEDGKPAGYAVIAMGKLGSGEMSFASDLDLIVLYEADGSTTRPADGSRQLTNSEFYHRLVQRAGAYISTMTMHGNLYTMDMKLRPSGSSGALVTTMDAFEEYQQRESMVWEKQAILKAMVLLGSDKLAERFARIRVNALGLATVNDNLRAEVADMRVRIEREKGRNPYDIKSAAGGLTDIEFAVQLLCLENRLCERNTFKALQILNEYGALSKRDYTAFERGYLFYRRIENMLRLYDNTPTTKLGEDSLARLSVSADDLKAHKRAVRAAYERVLG
ncbi:bifunctional [glutamate--ammonia ligase]-adenylyl-L-tyrosine phosphorylase/[glutamate--ammonia-ligase] adenylyltransferase [Deferribacterales bacterium RsTz2092]|nr:glutamate-ammonia-ligase adenylyltransferase [Deferribacterales bacterium]